MKVLPGLQASSVENNLLVKEKEQYRKPFFYKIKNLVDQ